jgi:hypothetical protein
MNWRHSPKSLLETTEIGFMYPAAFLVAVLCRSLALLYACACESLGLAGATGRVLAAPAGAVITDSFGSRSLFGHLPPSSRNVMPHPRAVPRNEDDAADEPEP